MNGTWEWRQEQEHLVGECWTAFAIIYRTCGIVGVTLSSFWEPAVKRKKNKKTTHQRTTSRLSIGHEVGRKRSRHSNRWQDKINVIHQQNIAVPLFGWCVCACVCFPTMATASVLQPPDVHSLVHRSCRNEGWIRWEATCRHIPTVEDSHHLDAGSEEIQLFFCYLIIIFNSEINSLVLIYQFEAKARRLRRNCRGKRNLGKQ